MKKIITNFLILIFCSIPRLIKAQMGIDKINVINEEKPAKPGSSKNIFFTPILNNLTDTLFSPFIKKQENNSVKEDIEKLSLVQIKYAMVLDVAVETLKNTTLYKFIESWYGTRYRLGGHTKKGIDCSAFADSLLAAVYNLFVPRTAREQYKYCERISKNDLMEGDLVFFNTHGGVSHVGIYLANGRFVHSSRSQGVMISSLSDYYFSRRFIGAGRVQLNYAKF